MDYISLKITNLEPLKIGSSNSSDTASYSKEYIAGGSIRGSIIGALINRGYDMNDLKKKTELLNHVKFTNAYLSNNGNRMIPMPLGFVADKKELASYSGESIDICSIYDEDIAGKKPVKKEGFVNLFGDTLEGVSANKTFNLHIGVNGRADNVSERAMYRYEALAENQNFISYIILDNVSENTKEEILNLFKEEKILYIGGSKGSGYGRCIVDAADLIATSNPEKIDSISYDGGNELYIYYVSDTILQNIYGESVGFLDKETFNKLTGVDADIEYLGGAVDNVMISGYNNMYGGTLPACLGIKAGSVQRYIIKGEESQQLKESLDKIEESGIGLRTEEGFGRVLFTNRLEFSNIKRAKKDTMNADAISLSDEDKEQLRIIGKRLFIARSKYDIEAAIVKENEKITRITVESSQLGKVVDILKGGYNITADQLQKEIKDYFDHMRDKSGNPRAYRQFVDTKIDGKQLNGYIIELVEKVDGKLLFASEHASKVVNHDLIVNISREDNYRLNLKYLIELFKYIRKGVR